MVREPKPLVQQRPRFIKWRDEKSLLGYDFLYEA